MSAAGRVIEICISHECSLMCQPDGICRRDRTCLDYCYAHVFLSTTVFQGGQCILSRMLVRVFLQLLKP